MTHMPTRIVVEPDGRDALLQQMQDENTALHAENGRLQAENERLRREGSAKEAEIARHQAEIAALRARLGRPKKTPRNSSVPPSQAVKPNASALPVAAATHPRRGHPGAHRTLCDNPTEVKDMRAGTCPHCAADLSEVAQSEGETYDHIEIPLAPAVITRVILRRGTCPCCRQAFKTEPPPGMEPGSPFGENLRASVLHLRQCHAISYERLVSVLDVQFGVQLSEGALASMLKAAAPAFAAQVAPIRSRLLAGTVIGSDETRFRVGKANWWLWVFQNADSCCFVIEPGRDKDVVERFLGGVRPRVWISDRLGSQVGWGEKHQACLAHLLRDAQYALDSGDTVLAGRVIPLLCRAIRVWHHRERLMRCYRRGVLDAFFWRHFLALSEMIAQPIVSNAAAEKFRRSLVRWQDKLFVFLAEPEASPTNNGSEQALRWSAVFRKVTNCFRSVWGARLHAEVRSVIETARRRGIKALEAILLTLRGQPLPVPM
jgi:transposase